MFQALAIGVVLGFGFVAHAPLVPSSSSRRAPAVATAFWKERVYVAGLAGFQQDEYSGSPGSEYT